MKEEPIVSAQPSASDFDDKVGAATALIKGSEAHEAKLSKQQLGNQNTLQSGQRGMKGTYNFFSVLLHCPRCPISFKCGFQGQGVKCLMKHVYNAHPKLKSFCRLSIRKVYGHIIEELKAGKL